MTDTHVVSDFFITILRTVYSQTSGIITIKLMCSNFLKIIILISTVDVVNKNMFYIKYLFGKTAFIVRAVPKLY